MTGRLLPTGGAVDEIELPDGRVIEVSIVDAGNPVVFLRASDLGASGTELPPEIEARTDLTDTLEAVRAIAAELLGIVPTAPRRPRGRPACRRSATSRRRPRTGPAVAPRSMRRRRTSAGA